MKTKEQLQVYRNRIEELTPIISKGFETSEELQSYKKKNQELFNEYYDTYELIKALEWELMTQEERKRQEEIDEKIKKKRGKIK